MASAAERAAVASVDADGLQAWRGGALQGGDEEEENEEEIHEEWWSGMMGGSEGESARPIARQ